MNEPAPEFSYLIHPDRLSPAGIEEILQPKPAERAALARRFDLIDLPRLVATLSVKPELRGTVRVKGVIEADVVQRCVVTLEPLANHLAIPIVMIFVPENLQSAGAGSPDADEGEEDFDTYAHNRIDLGEMVAQYLGINLDPYPRKPDASLDQTEFGANAEKPHPLARLAELAQKPGKSDKSGN